MTRGIRVVGAGVESDDDRRSLPEPKTARRPRPATTRKQAAAPAPRPAGRGAGAARRGTKAWSGRLDAATHRLVEGFTASLDVDRRLLPDDIAGSQAHARMLRRIGLLTAAELKTLEAGLRDVRRDLESGEATVGEADEDIHMAVERLLYERVGDVAGRLHTARSRNDQVATDLLLYAKRACRELTLAVAALQEALLKRAREHRATLMPGYTHLQRAQVVSLGHHLLAYVEMLQRDVERLQDCHDRCDRLPLGSGALAATTLPIDRRAVADDLGFDHVTANSLDAVGDRDFVVEIASACALLMVHLSRLAEEIILWTTTEFGFASLPDTHATGSSLMPQKKNPDVLELIRGRTGRVVGDVVALLTMLKGLPLAYNRDLQEDKRAFFDALDVSGACVGAMAEVVAVLRFDVEALERAASDPALIATDVADYLVVKGVPFREAHARVGAAVRLAGKAGRALDALTLEEWRTIDERFDDDVLELFDPRTSLRRREVPGGPGPRVVSRQLARAAAMIAKTRGLATVLAKHPGAVREVGAATRSRSAD